MFFLSLSLSLFFHFWHALFLSTLQLTVIIIPEYWWRIFRCTVQLKWNYPSVISINITKCIPHISNGTQTNPTIQSIWNEFSNNSIHITMVCALISERTVWEHFANNDVGPFNLARIFFAEKFILRIVLLNKRTFFMEIHNCKCLALVLFFVHVSSDWVWSESNKSSLIRSF